MRAMPAIYAVVLVAFLATPAILTASSKKNLQRLQISQTANSTGTGQATGGANGDNLKLENVDFSTRGAILKNLPKRIRDLILKPYPWQLSDTSQRFGALGTLVAYAVLLLMIWYAWLSRGNVFPRSGPLLYPLLFMLVAYSLAAGNAGTGFRYRTHLVPLGIAVVVILREHVLLVRARSSPQPTEVETERSSFGAPVTSPI
jgi:peptidoglycan/LPS O-acetylase OafA/YrhL